MGFIWKQSVDLCLYVDVIDGWGKDGIGSKVNVMGKSVKHIRNKLWLVLGQTGIGLGC